MMRLALLSGVSVIFAVMTGLSLGQPPAPKPTIPAAPPAAAPMAKPPAPAADKPPDNVAQTEPRTPEEERKGFHLPPGFEIQLVAAEPYVRKPINMNFDDRGRLWVTESIEYPFPAPPNAPQRDTVRILEDTNGDGLADEVTTFTDGLNIPIGVLPVSGGAIVYSIPNIYRLYDVDGDDRADKRELLYGTFGHRDTHGMTGEFTWGFDGWIYACHGFSNTSEVKGADGSRIEMQSGNVYRFKLDGSHVEYWTHGQVNPFGLTFDPLGNLYSCDCETRPIYMLLRGGYYPSFGKPHDGLGFAPEMMTYGHGPTAIAGITYYAADHFPPAYRDTIFVGNVVTNRINHDRLERHGSTYKTVIEPDFLTSDDPWFRPVDIKPGPDGALYVADFYNRIIGHYEVPLTHPGRDHGRGRIWRIVYCGSDGKGQARAPRADWSKASVPELIQDLAHPNLVVRSKGTNQLVQRGGPAVVRAVREVMSKVSHPYQRMHGLWVLERLGALDDTLLQEATRDPESGVRVHAMHVLAERGVLAPALQPLILAALKDEDAFVQRAAAEVMQTHPSPAYLAPLLELKQRVPTDDSHLMHMVRMALREQLLTPDIWSQLPRPSWSEQEIRAVADVAPGVPTPEAAAFLLEYLGQRPETYANQLRYANHIARYGADASVVGLWQLAREDRAASLKHQVDLFKAIQQGIQAHNGQLGPAADEWAGELVRRLLGSNQDSEVVTGVELCGLLKLAGTKEMLEGIARDHAASETQRSAALNALVAMEPASYIAFLNHLVGDATEPFGLRDKASNALAGINKPEAQAALLQNLPLVPEQLALTIAAGLTRNRQGAEKLLDAVALGRASARLLQESRVTLPLTTGALADLKGRVITLTADLPAADKRLHELICHRRTAYTGAKVDAGLGQKVFEKNCAVCHRVGDHGAKVGPQLDGVGVRGVDRLLEDILDPNRNVDQAFRVTTLTLTTGQIVSGLVLREEGAVLVLADSQGKEVRIPKAAVDERLVSPLSPMPANFGEQISEADLSNLLAFLLTQQPAREAHAKVVANPPH